MCDNHQTDRVSVDKTNVEDEWYEVIFEDDRL